MSAERHRIAVGIAFGIAVAQAVSSMPSLLHRWFVQYNPLYLVSATLVLAGVIVLSQSTLAQGGALGQLSIAGIAEVYGWALIGSAALLYRIRLRRAAVMLALLTALFQCDLTLQTARSAYLGAAGVLGTAVWLASFVAKLHAIAWALRLRLSLSARIVPILGAIALATAPWLLRMLDGSIATTVVGRIVFIVAAAGLWTSRAIDSRDRLDAWPRIVARRCIRAVWIGWPAAGLLHLWFLSTHGASFDAAILLPVAGVLATRYVQREHSVWTVLVAVLLAVAVFRPEDLWVTSLMAATAFGLRTFRRPSRLCIDTEPPPTHPYRTNDPPPPTKPPQWTFAPAPLSDWPRLLTAAGTCLYLSAWMHGWHGGPLHDPPLLPALCFVVAAALVSWRVRTWPPLLPATAIAVHSAFAQNLVPIPRGSVQWGVSSIATGFVVLALSLALSVRWRARSP